ncbi:MAG TPA: nitroreductase [Ramlibacter sp.]|nr:nitroreductase [Ramlibacter sp.]
MHVLATDARSPSPAALEPASAEWAEALIHHRQTILPKRLFEPGPDAAQLERILATAGAAPDHGELVPWRFIIVPASERSRLADAFAASLLERDPRAAADDVEKAREKAFRAPLLMLAVVDTGAPGSEIPKAERYISAGCAIQNMLLMATALCFASSVTGGKALRSRELRELFALRETEDAVCFMAIGTADRNKPIRQRPQPSRYVSVLAPKPDRVSESAAAPPSAPAS